MMKLHLIDDWQKTLRWAWSVRLWGAAIALDIAAEVLPRYFTQFDELTLSILSFACMLGGIAMRFVAQEKCK